MYAPIARMLLLGTTMMVTVLSTSDDPYFPRSHHVWRTENNAERTSLPPDTTSNNQSSHPPSQGSRLCWTCSSLVAAARRWRCRVFAASRADALRPLLVPEERLQHGTLPSRHAGGRPHQRHELQERVPPANQATHNKGHGDQGWSRIYSSFLFGFASVPVFVLRAQRSREAYRCDAEETSYKLASFLSVKVLFLSISVWIFWDMSLI